MEKTTPPLPNVNDSQKTQMPPTFGVGRCDCSRSDRGWEVAGGYTSRESHVRRLDDTLTSSGESFLGNHAQFCHAFFHLSPTPELVEHPVEVCVRSVVEKGKKCETKGVVVVAALREADNRDVTFLSRYSVRPNVQSSHQ